MQRDSVIKYVLIDYENFTNICYGCDQQDHIFGNLMQYFLKVSISKQKKSGALLGTRNL